MTGGVPVWHGNLEDQELSNLFGFIKAYVVCPSTITRPFLPYRDNNKTLLFPTGKFVDVYFSEELIYARYLGYKIIPIRGYLFEKKHSPFESFVSSLFGRRQEAKKNGNDAMSYVYKILMNSLYGRFGINPKSTITEVCDRKRYDHLIQRDNLIFGDKLSEHYYMVSYVSNTGHVDDSDWNPPKIFAIQLAAAITACARIHMYKYISRNDCYYTDDTDSAILGSALPEEENSSIQLGKFKMEHFVKKGIFLAPKSYTLVTDDEDQIIKHKGPAKSYINYQWFESQYADPSRTKQINVESKFRIDWHTLNIAKKDYQISLRIKADSKREPIYDDQNIWVDTKPKDVIDFGGQENTILKFELKILKQENAFLKDIFYKIEKEYDQRIDSIEKEYTQRITSMEKEMAKLHDEIKSLSAPKLPEEPVIQTDYPTVLEVTQPTLDKQSTKAKKKQKGKKQKGKNQM